MASYSMTFNLGSGDEGRSRDDHYRKAAAAENLSLNAWAKKYLDNASENLPSTVKNSLDTVVNKS